MKNLISISFTVLGITLKIEHIILISCLLFGILAAGHCYQTLKKGFEARGGVIVSCIFFILFSLIIFIIIGNVKGEQKDYATFLYSFFASLFIFLPSIVISIIRWRKEEKSKK